MNISNKYGLASTRTNDYSCGETPLHNALMNNLWDCSKQLIHAGANILAKNSEGITCYDIIERSENAELLRLAEGCCGRVFGFCGLVA